MSLERPDSDKWLDEQLKAVEIPKNLCGDLAAICELTDEELDQKLDDVAIPAGLIERLQLIAYEVPRRTNYAQLAVAASLVLMIGASYLSSAFAILWSAYDSPVADGSGVEITSLALEEPAVSTEDLQEPLKALELEFLSVEPPQFSSEPEEEMFVSLPQDDQYFPALDQVFVSDPARPISPIIGSGDTIEDPEILITLLPNRIPKGIATPLVWDRKFLVRNQTNPFVSLFHPNRPDLVHPAWPALSTIPAPVVHPSTPGELRNQFVKGETRPDPKTIRVEAFTNALQYQFEKPIDNALALTVNMGPSPFAQFREVLPRAVPVHLMQVGLRAKTLVDELRPAVRTTLLIDCSRSMSVDGRLAMVRSAVLKFAKNLKRGDSLSLVVFDDRATWLTPIDLTSDDPESIKAALDSIRVRRSSTNIVEGLKLGYAVAKNYGEHDFRSQRLILISDGLHKLTNESYQQITKALHPSIRDRIELSVIDVGYNAEPNKQFKQIAKLGSGELFTCRTQFALHSALVSVLTQQSQIVAKNTTMSVTFNPHSVFGYRMVGHDASDPLLLGEPVSVDLVSGQTSASLFELYLRPNAAETIATIDLYWTEPWNNNEQKHITYPVKVENLVQAFNMASVDLQRAAVVAEGAEILKKSPFSQKNSLKNILELAPPLEAETHGRIAFRNVIQILQTLSQMKQK